MEIYNEKVNDLLKTGNNDLKLYENPKGGIVIKGLEEKVCNSYSDIQKLLNIGEISKHFCSTELNEKSSRAHIRYLLINIIDLEYTFHQSQRLMKLLVRLKWYIQ